MNAIDTNVLVRVLINDDQIQAYKAVKLIGNNAPVFVSEIVLCETIWVLQSRYGFNKAQLISAIEKVLKIKELHIEHNDAMWSAFHEFQYIAADFSDCVIGAVAKHHGCSAVSTFDKNAAKSKNFKLIK